MTRDETIQSFSHGKYVLDKCVTADALGLLDSEGARTVLAVSPYSVPAGVPLQQMPVVVNLPTIPCEESPAPAQATEVIPITKVAGQLFCDFPATTACR